MTTFKIDALYQLVKTSVDKADLESLGPSAATDEYDFEAREITERLCERYDSATADELTVWLTAYWARQFNALMTEEWVGSRDFRALAVELIGYRQAVDSPAAHLQYLQWERAAGIGCAVTNEELLELVSLWTTRLAEHLYQKLASGSNRNNADTGRQYVVLRLRQIASSVGFGETRRVMIRELLTWGARVDSHGFLVCLRSEISRYTGSRRYPEEIEPEKLQIHLQDCVSLFVECVLTQAASVEGCDWDDFPGTSGAHIIN